MKNLIDYLLLTMGSIIVAIGLELIIALNGLVDGGVTAISVMAKLVFNNPIWAVFIMLNIPAGKHDYSH